eukprot:TRINITY_DN36981_c0_g1_i1.p1 TRINITY_DN36981_c0_g1~~TRINITY_DN36981_c0_g1_i1.p1  ORF type:complete len:234 (+),score=31.43 TRINITY_DN36981_c0_g1_i1:53-703(+)
MPLSHDIGSPHPVAYKDCEPMKLMQRWEGASVGPTEGGHAYVKQTEAGLVFYSYFCESEPFTTATGDQQELYLKGSVAEFFIHHTRGNGFGGEYWEIHLSPNGHITDIKIPNRDDFMKGDIKWSDCVKFSSNSTFRVKQGDGFWASEIVVPWSAFGLSEGPVKEQEWGVSVSRYNYPPGDFDNPELSSTAALTKLSYHRIEEFNIVSVGPISRPKL